MISFQHIQSGRFLRSVSPWQDVPLLADAMPWHPSDESWLRERHSALANYRTVTYSSRIDHPSNDLAKLSTEELAERYPISH